MCVCLYVSRKSRPVLPKSVLCISLIETDVFLDTFCFLDGQLYTEMDTACKSVARCRLCTVILASICNSRTVHFHVGHIVSLFAYQLCNQYLVHCTQCPVAYYKLYTVHSALSAVYSVYCAHFFLSDLVTFPTHTKIRF